MNLKGTNTNITFFLPMILVWLVAGISFGQNTKYSNYATSPFEFAESNDTILSNEWPIVPGSIKFKIDGIWIIPDASCLEYKNNLLIWMCERSILTNVTHIQYRFFKFQTNKIYNTRYRPLSKPLAKNYDGLYVRQLNETKGIDNSSGLDYSGVFNRSLSLGSNQDLYLNSNFNLQLSGKIGDGIEILGAITDNNFPIQPQGNTQQLQEFDRIFIKLSKKNFSLTMGDEEIRNQEWSYFSKYFKKIQGVRVENTWNQNNSSLQLSGSGAVSKGKFNRLQLTVVEGNQGPYKISGADGEPYIVVLAGTERIFWDGVLLSRGENNDYIMDYNQGEITFTPKRMITKDSRIVIEYEYSAQYYTRSVITTDLNYTRGRLKADFSIYSEQDGRVPTELQLLSDADRMILAEAGDNFNNVFSSGIRPVEEGEDPQVTYNQIDTIVDGRSYNILIKSREGGGNLFTAQFSKVSGGGNYRLGPNDSNGRYYEWVAPNPENGLPQGEYEPIKVLVPPQLQQLYNAGVKYDFNGGGFVRSELAMSNKNLNRFSTLDNNDNQGFAGNLQGEKTLKLSRDTMAWSLKLGGIAEWRNEDFRTINPYRNVEFTRDWNVRAGDTVQQSFGQLFAELRNPVNSYNGQVGYSFFNIKEIYSGQKYSTAQSFNKGGWKISLKGSILDTESDINSKFNKVNSGVEYTFKKLKNVAIGGYFEKEQNNVFNNGDSLIIGSFDYDLQRVYFEIPDLNRKLSTRFSIDYRQDYNPLGGEFSHFSSASDYMWAMGWKPDANHNVQWNLTYRELKIENFDLNNSGVKEGRKFLGRVNYSGSYFKNLIQTNTVYEINSGQEPKTELTYIRVDKGRGTHIWTDYNDDGLQQISEFDLAPYPDTADFVQFFNRTDALVGVNNITFNQSLNIIPKGSTSTDNFYQKIYKKLALISQFSINRKTEEAESFNPFTNFRNDSALISGQLTNNHILYFNRNNRIFEIQLGHNGASNRSLLLAGFETRSTGKQFVRYRHNIKNALTLILEGSLANEYSNSELNIGRNYEIENQELKTEIAYQKATTSRFSLKYNYKKSKNLSGLEAATIHEVGLGNTLSNSNIYNLRVDFSSIFIRYVGAENSPLALAMLDGFRNGTNIVTNITFERKISDNIRMSIGYEGRKSPNTRIVHVARAQVGAIF